MSGYDEIGAMNFADGYILAGGKIRILRKLLMKEYDMDEATANWHIEQAQKWKDNQVGKLMGFQDKKYDKKSDYMYLPTLTEDEFIENIESDDFFRRFGNPAIIRAEAGDNLIVMSVELYDRMVKLCGFPETEELIKNEP